MRSGSIRASDGAIVRRWTLPAARGHVHFSIAPLMQNRGGNWLLPDKANLVNGRVQGHVDGFGFLDRIAPLAGGQLKGQVGQVFNTIYAGSPNPDQLLISEGRILVVTHNGAYVAGLVTLSTLLGMASLPFALGVLR